LAVVIFLVVEKTLNKNSAQAGFVFMAGSALKFLIFFLVFYPTYKEDDNMKTIEFIAFFIPYSICLITEVIYLSKQLNNQST
jgi:F0F1-type ATP synthase assembly protein I